MEIIFSFRDHAIETRQGSTTLVMQVNNTLDTVYANLTMRGPAFQNSSYAPSIEVFEQGTTTYIVSPIPATNELSCNAYPRETQAGFLNPDHMIGPLGKAQLIKQNESINGILTDHYHIENSEDFFLEMQSIEATDVNAWVEQNAGYLVKLHAQAIGASHLPESPDTIIQGTFIMTYDLTNINKVPDVVLPDICSQTQVEPTEPTETTEPTEAYPAP